MGEDVGIIQFTIIETKYLMLARRIVAVNTTVNILAIFCTKCTMFLAFCTELAHRQHIASGHLFTLETAVAR